MGALTSRQNAGVEEVDIPANSVYRYPPKSGSYFANHFIMGGEKFDSTHPEGYLFGENSDLNFLGNRPVVEPVKTLRSLINIRKDTLRLVKCSEEVKTPGEEVSKAKVHYNVEFTFDTDARVAITIYYQASEEFHNGVASYIPRDNSLQSETVHYKRGVCQQFCVPSHTVDPSEWSEEELGFDLDREVYPMVVHAVVDEGEEHTGHCHVLLATFEKHSDGTFCVKPLKQKQVVDGVSYLLQEIYGIENKYNTQDSKVAEDEVSDNSAECVVCLSDVRDTLILPCRHLCLCNTCADTLRYQANNCPICRLPFRALLQIRAMRKKLGPLSPTSFNPIIASQTSDSEEHSSSENIPPGYEVVSLLEALNGPLTPSPAPLPLRALGDPPGAGTLPSYGSDGPLPPLRALSPLERLPDCGPPGLKLKKSLSKSISQNSSILPEEEDEKSCTESELRVSRRRSPARREEECGATPDSENLTLSSSGAIDQSSCTGTPLSSTISSPEEPVSSSLAQSVMSMASSQSQHSQLSTDTVSSMSGSYIAPGTEEEEEGDMLPSPAAASATASDGESTPVESPDINFVSISAEERDAEGNDVLEDEDASPTQEDGDAKKQSYLPQPQKPPSSLQSLATASFAPRIQVLPPPGIPAALAHALMVPERLRQEVTGATVVRLYRPGTAQPCRGEGLVEPWAGGGGAGSRVPVPVAASSLFCCPSDAAGAREGAARTVPRHYCPLFTHSHLDASFLSIFFERGWGGERKRPRNPTPHH
ncbi:E3 ubiquitin ligase RNF157 isoform X2 [Aptenodytes patagonicus]|uniref:E3 ubiquitin ligase RNF157 isoform X2 n=1 Tax=Aptenodytes patagonicus TaxID=9234 RepID=UPI003FA14539